MVERKPLVQLVVDELRNQVLVGDYKPGDLLPSREQIASELEVGVSTVHEAVRVLSAVGLLDSRPGVGTWVRDDALKSTIRPAAIITRLGDIDVRSIFEARSVIEVGTTELAAARATPGDIQIIWDALKEMEKALNDPEAYVEADLEFHLAVAAASGNPLLEDLYQLARDLLSGLIVAVVPDRSDREIALKAQITIAEMIEKGDITGARKASRKHMELVRESLDWQRPTWSAEEH
jgi:DNA-binding FadR family transcriptional regulator